MEDRRAIQDLIELQLQAQDRGWSTEDPFVRWFIFAVTLVAADLLFITGQWFMGLFVVSVTIASLVGMRSSAESASSMRSLTLRQG